MTNELLFSVTKKDLEIQYFSGTGAGGQHRNKHQNCVRIHHKDSGVTVTGQSARDRVSNTKEALHNLVNHAKFKIWLNRKAWEIMDGKTLEERVDSMLAPENLKVEAKDEKGKWTLFVNEVTKE